MVDGPRALLAPLAVLALLAPTAIATTTGQTLLEAEGQLLVGTAGVRIGELGPVTSSENTSSPPVSHAEHPFTVPDCPRWLHVVGNATTIPTEEDTWEDPTFDPALIRVLLVGPNGSRVAGEFGNTVNFATEAAQPTGNYTLDVDHLVGTPIVYNVTVTATNDCET